MSYTVPHLLEDCGGSGAFGVVRVTEAPLVDVSAIRFDTPTVRRWECQLQDFQLSHSELGGLFSVATIFAGMAQPALGRTMDRFGGRVAGQGGSQEASCARVEEHMFLNKDGFGHSLESQVEGTTLKGSSSHFIHPKSPRGHHHRDLSPQVSSLRISPGLPKVSFRPEE